MKYQADNSLTIGGTPLVQIQRLVDARRVKVWAKIEGRNPTYSVKDRIAAAMVWDAERRGILKPGMTIIEPTSGNTGIALAGVGAARGYRVSVVMPDSMSAERRQLIQALGAQIILTAGAAGMAGALHKAEELLQADPERYFMPQQFKNPANPAIHEQTTGPEIWQATAGAVDVVISGVGTGGTLTGIARYFKHRRAKPILSVAVEPAASPLLAQKKAGQPLRPAPHGLQGLGANFIPQTLDWALVDRIEPATEEEALEYAQRLAREEGILAGISSGAAMAVAARLARTAAFEGQRLVVILPDSGERYLSTDLYRLAH